MKALFFFVLFIIALLQAETLDAKIARMMKAPPSKRYKLMNEIKRELVKLKSKERIAALKRLQKATQNKRTKKTIDAIIQQQTHTKLKGKHASQTYQRTETYTENIIESTLEIHQINEIDTNDILPYEEYDDDSD